MNSAKVLAHYFLHWFVVNDCIPHIPFWSIRRMLLKSIGVKIGEGSIIMKQNYFMEPRKFTIGEYSHINRGCLIDARGGITIGNSVSISHNVSIVTGGHDYQDSKFPMKNRPIQIDDYVWIGVGCIILQGVHIGKGAVVCSGAVVNKDVECYQVVAGVPAKKVGERNANLNYKCEWNVPFT